MSKRIKTNVTRGRDYAQMLKEYFGFHLYGLEVTEEGGQIQAQVIYTDFKHIDTVRRELAQMMPEVEFTKLRRDYSESAVKWALAQMIWEGARHPSPTLYMQMGENLTRTSIRDIAISELRQLELDEDDEREMSYTDFEKKLPDEDRLRQNSWD